MTDHTTKYDAVLTVTQVEGAGPDVSMLGEASPKPMYERVTAVEVDAGQATLVFDSTEHGRHRRGDQIAVSWTHTTEHP